MSGVMESENYRSVVNIVKVLGGRKSLNPFTVIHLPIVILSQSNNRNHVYYNDIMMVNCQNKNIYT